MRLYLTTVAIVAHICVPEARADFVLTPAPTPLAASEPRPAASAPPPAGQPPEDAPVPTKMEPPRTPRFAEVSGFGNNVTLRFAVRQIVPPAVKVTYGPGIDPDQILSWHGDAGWNWVLANAVRPLGLHLVMTHMAVEIAK